MSGQQRDIILQESGKASFQAKLPEEKPFLCRASSRIRTYEVIRQRIYSPPSLPLEHSRIFKWSLVESNHVFGIFSPAHTPSLPKLQCCDS